MARSSAISNPVSHRFEMILKVVKVYLSINVCACLWMRLWMCLCFYECVCTFRDMTYVYECVYVYKCVYEYVYISMIVSINVSINVYLWMCMYVSTSRLWVCLWIYPYVYECVYECIHMSMSVSTPGLWRMKVTLYLDPWSRQVWESEIPPDSSLPTQSSSSHAGTGGSSGAPPTHPHTHYTSHWYDIALSIDSCP